MKVVFVVLALVCFRASLLYADVGSSNTHDTTEVVLIAANVAASFVNVAMVGAHDPQTWAIGLGVATGLTSIIYAATAENVERGTGLALTALAAISTSVLSLGIRNNHDQVHLEPGWHNGSAGFALAIDF